ncbi:MAG: phosphatase PAP2 family protein [Armatimonadetes bacterium]|nr:phosphatase PAP2 family protein [Armatimonadota bacterium]
MNLFRALCLVFLLSVAAGGVLADDAAPPTQEPDHSTIINLAPQLPSVICTTEQSEPQPQNGSSSDSKRDRDKDLLDLAKRAAIAYALDQTVSRLASSALGSEEADKISSLFSGIGGRGMVGALGIGYLAGGKQTKRTCGSALEAASEAMLMTESLKFLSGRMRPREPGSDADDFRGPGAGYKSFPSGHVSNAFAIATVLGERHPKRKWLYRALALGVGLSRVQKQAHYLSDVVVGAAIGTYAGRRAIKGQTFAGKVGRLRDKTISGKD